MMTKKTVQLPDWPWQPVRRLAEERGIRLWLVGGAVRDALLDRPLHDWDFAVDRNALGLARAVADALDGMYYPLDADRGTGRVILEAENSARLMLDFAALRGDGLEDDLSARDFTINALALDETGTLVDVTSGKTDLNIQRIRATSEGTFRADPVRLLRAVRMEVELGFKIEPQTVSWIRRDAELLTLASAERVRDEFMRVIALPRAADSLQRLDELGLLERVVPEIAPLKEVAQSPPHRFNVWQHTLLVVDTLEGIIAVVTGRDVETPTPAGVPDAAWGDVARTLGQFADDVRTHLAVEVSGGRDRAQLLKLAALLHDIGKYKTQSRDEEERIHFYNHDRVGAPIATARLRELRFSRNELDRMLVMVGQHLRPAHLARAERLTRRAVYRYFRATGCAGVDVMLLSLSDHLATYGPNLQERRWLRRLEVAEILLTHCFERYEETIDPPPLVTGDDLMDALDLAPGPEIGRLLQAIQEAQAAGEVHTHEEALATARRLMGSKG